MSTVRVTAETLFKRYGGFAQVSRIVSGFYGRVLDDESLRPFFKGVDMKRRTDH